MSLLGTIERVFFLQCAKHFFLIIFFYYFQYYITTKMLEIDEKNFNPQNE